MFLDDPLEKDRASQYPCAKTPRRTRSPVSGAALATKIASEAPSDGRMHGDRVGVGVSFNAGNAGNAGSISPYIYFLSLTLLVHW